MNANIGNRSRRRRGARVAALLVVAALPAACAVPKPVPKPTSPFAGAWTTAEHQQIAFREGTVVINSAEAPPTALNAASCSGRFGFAYARRSRDELLALVPRQPDLRGRLAGLLVRPDYPIAELSCGEGGTTYVLLDQRDLLAIHRDRDIAGIERLSRP